MAPKTIDCQFNLFEEGRNYSGNHRKYVLESAISTCYAPQTRERLQLREAFGYFGHQRRLLAGNLEVPEVCTVKMPDGSSMLLENIPSNVTTAFEITKDGVVKHSQQILESNKPGQIVAALHADKVGGFSWACDGKNGGVLGLTKVSQFYGFDYVTQPGFANNRGYIMESAGNDTILESVARATGLPDNEVKGWIERWTSTAILENADLQELLLQTAQDQTELQEELSNTAALLESANAKLREQEGMKAVAKRAILEAAGRSAIAIPDAVMHAMLNMSSGEEFQTVVSFFESAKQVRLSALPIGEKSKIVIPHKGIHREVPQYGTAAAAPDFSKY